MAHESYVTFDQVKTRLDEIVDAVGSEEMPLDEALSLYEEAVGLGLRASELLEEDIEARNELDDVQDGGAEAEAEAATSAEVAVSDAGAPETATA